MSSLRQVLLGFLAALLSSALVLGGISLALLQGDTTTVAMAPTATLLATEGPSIEITILPGEPDLTVLAPTPSETFPAPACTPPDGWVQRAVGPDETMQSLADVYGLPVEEFAQANCLFPSSPLNGSMTISVPATTTSTATSTATAAPPPTQRLTRTPLVCGRPTAWQIYIVKHGDNLYQIAQMFNTTVSALQNANCLTGTLINTGQLLYVPYVAIHTPVPTVTLPPSATATSLPPTMPPTRVPTTAVPTITVPPTAVPTTAVPTTAVPTTAVPTTVLPTTAVPTTAIPTTAVATTSVPTTAVPTTAVPTTAVPTTAVPTTAVPPTADPTTAVPTTLVPSTVDPTMSSSVRLHFVASTWKRDRTLAAFWETFNFQADRLSR